MTFMGEEAKSWNAGKSVIVLLQALALGRFCKGMDSQMRQRVLQG